MTARRTAQTIWLLALLAAFAPATALGQAALQRLERQLAQPGVRPAAQATPSAVDPAQPEPPKAGDLPPAPGAEPGYLGIIAVDHDTQGRGVRLVDVLAGGPAALGGLKIGDLITSIDGTAIADRAAMAEVMKDRVAGEQVTFVVLRDGEVARLDVMLSKRPPPEERRFANFGTIGVDTTAIGGAPLPGSSTNSPTIPQPPQPQMPSMPAPSASGAAPLPAPQVASVSPAPVKVPENSLPTPKVTATQPQASDLPAPVVVPQPNIDVGPLAPSGPVAPNGPVATAARTGLLGIRTARVTPELQLALNLPEPRGALVVEVRPGSPANVVGIPVEAVIVAVDAERVNSPDDLLAVVRERGPGAEVRLSYYRYGQLYERRVKLEAPVEVAPPIEGPLMVAPSTVAPNTVAPNTVAPTVAPPQEPATPSAAAEAELRREVAELERRLADLKRQLDAKPAPADKKN
ncbi:MAG: PDZ domain-containing protein [Planctomycetales bacterium]|nr:PDZ domain-containing protein [Planctomycetales bacterium]